MVAEWQRTAPFPITYIFQENAGKHVAFNRAVAKAKGDLFLTLDSDDALLPNALERLKFHWDAIPENEKRRFSAVSGLCVDQRGAVLGDRFPRDVLDSDSIELVYRYKVKGDKFGFHKTEVLRRHPFPEPPGVKFVAEGVLWFAIARKFKTRFVNERLLRVYRAARIGKDNLSALTSATAIGRLVFHRAVLNEHCAYLFPLWPSGILRSLINYSRYSFLAGDAVLTQFIQLRSWGCRAGLACAVPLGYALYLKNRYWDTVR
jgi:glycosyltransferase involved in cell wall biosynthesis